MRCRKESGPDDSHGDGGRRDEVLLNESGAPIERGDEGRESGGRGVEEGKSDLLPLGWEREGKGPELVGLGVEAEGRGAVTPDHKGLPEVVAALFFEDLLLLL